jgi:transposase-like protein
MKTKEFGVFIAQISKLTAQQRNTTLEQIKRKCDINTIGMVLNSVESCPHCSCTTLYKWGINANIQRYKCKACNKTFNALTNTPLARLRHKEKWSDFAQDVIDGKSILDSAKHCSVDKSTTFRWRHRFLQIPSSKKAQHLEGIVEADETYFLNSHKGNNHDLDRASRKRRSKATKRGLSSEQIPVLIVRDRNRHTTDAILQHSNTQEITKVLSPLVDEDILLCSDGNPIYQAFAKAKHITHKVINASAGEHTKEGAYHIQNVNAYDSRLKNWMRRFHGVATKYLENYLEWMRILDSESDLTPERLLGISARRVGGVYT